MSSPFDLLSDAARQVMPRAYAPYSGYPVMAAARDAAGVIFTGVNIENASYGLTQCAEQSLITAWRMADGAALTHLVCLNQHGDYITPCGRCRQVLIEHAAPELLVATDHGPVRLADLLPAAFGPQHL